MPSRKYDFIDSLRGIAFLGVFACHVAGYLRVPGFVRVVMGLGGVGVQLFFMISPLTLFLSLDGRKAAEARPTRNFFIRRFFRIAPLYYLAVCFYSVFFGGNAFDPLVPRTLTPGSVLSTVTFTNGWSPTWINQIVPGGWSIAVEMNFYLLVPFLRRRLTTLRRALLATLGVWALGAAASAIAGVALVSRATPQDAALADAFLHYWLPCQLYRFFSGFVLYLLLRDRLRAGRGQEDPTWSKRLSILLLALSVLWLSVSSIKSCPPPLARPLSTLGLFAFSWSLAIHPHRAFVNRWMSAIGKVSFSAYVTHFAILFAIDRAAQGAGLRPDELPWAVWSPAFCLVALAATYGISVVTHRLVETPGQDLGRRWMARLAATRPPLPAPEVQAER